MLTARWHHNQDVPLQGEDDVGDVVGAHWELPSYLTKNIINNFYTRGCFMMLGH
jgi:hypothetical protein